MRQAAPEISGLGRQLSCMGMTMMLVGDGKKVVEEMGEAVVA